MNQQKISIRFYNDHEVRAVWSEETSRWYFSVLDVVGAINEQDDYTKTRNYWKYLKAKLKKENNELVSATTQLKLRASDGKSYLTDTLDADGIALLAKAMPNQKATALLDKYVEMNVAHPFMEGNGRSTRIWLDLMLKARHHCCIDWSKINKFEYLDAMTQSVADSTHIKQLLHDAITNETDSRELFMKGIDYSYYYEQEDK